jgi:hypothetical protein
MLALFIHLLAERVCSCGARKASPPSIASGPAERCNLGPTIARGIGSPEWIRPDTLAVERSAVTATSKSSLFESVSDVIHS